MVCLAEAVNDSLITFANRALAVGTISIKGAGGNWQARSLNGLNTMFLFFCFDNASSNITTADKIFTLDQNVRPTITMHVPGFVITEAGKVARCWYNITADGGVYQGVTGYCRAGYGFGFYTLS